MGSYYDKKEDLMFIRSCTRLEKSTDIISEIENYKKHIGWNDIRFTHEWQMDRNDVRKQLEACCRWDGEMSD